MTDADPPHDSSAQLVGTFVSTAERVIAETLRPLALRSAIEVLEYDATGWRSARPETITGWFLAEVRFANAAIAGAFTFGDRDNCLNIIVGHSAAANQYALWEWAQAFGQSDLAAAPQEWVYRLDRMTSTLLGYGAALGALYPLIVAADDRVLSRMDQARADVRAEDSESLRAREQDRDETIAAEAFRRGAYDEAARLLAAHEGHLGPAQQRKLELARRSSRGRPS